MPLYIVTQFSSLLAKLGSLASHAEKVTGEPSTQLSGGKKEAMLRFHIWDYDKYQTYLEYPEFCLPKGFIQIYCHTNVVLPV